MTDNGRNNTSREAIEWAKQVADLGAGEVVLTAIHKEGLGLGLDLDLITEVSKSLSIPVVAGGGIGTISHKDLFTNSDANAVTLAQALHWDKLKLKEIQSYCSQTIITLDLSNQGNKMKTKTLAIIDYEIGNVFSVFHAIQAAKLTAS